MKSATANKTAMTCMNIVGQRLTPSVKLSGSPDPSVPKMKAKAMTNRQKVLIKKYPDKILDHGRMAE
jgi:hypothetical protein